MSIDTSESEGSRHGISRRSLIKRGAVAGGVALWAPPVVESFIAKASAASAPFACSTTALLNSTVTTVSSSTGTTGSVTYLVTISQDAAGGGANCLNGKCVTGAAATYSISQGSPYPSGTKSSLSSSSSGTNCYLSSSKQIGAITVTIPNDPSSGGTQHATVDFNISVACQPGYGPCTTILPVDPPSASSATP